VVHPGGAGSGGDGIVHALRGLEIQLNLIMKQEQQILAGMRGCSKLLSWRHFLLSKAIFARVF
jgi:hypothetical protein